MLLAVQKGDPAILDRLLKYNESCQKAKSRHLRQLVSLIGLLVLFALAMVLATIGGLENPRWVEVLLASAGGGASLPTLIERFGNSR